MMDFSSMESMSLCLNNSGLTSIFSPENNVKMLNYRSFRNEIPLSYLSTCLHFLSNVIYLVKIFGGTFSVCTSILEKREKFSGIFANEARNEVDWDREKNFSLTRGFRDAGSFP